MSGMMVNYICGQISTDSSATLYKITDIKNYYLFGMILQSFVRASLQFARNEHVHL